jgi:hypothetical protein
MKVELKKCGGSSSTKVKEERISFIYTSSSRGLV